MEKLLEILNGINDETPIEEMRRAVLDVIDSLDGIKKDTEEYQNLVNEQQTKIDDLEFEIARLKEENGRIFRERAEQIQRNIDEKIDEIDEKSQEDMEAELIENIDI